MTQTASRRKISTNGSASAGSQTQTMERAKVTRAELAKHMSMDDAWTSIDGEVYDITQWIPLHPGGRVIRMAAGREAACLFESYHPGESMKKVKAALQNKCPYIGRLEGSGDAPDKSFFTEVQRRCEAKLKEKKLPTHYFEWLSALDVLFMLIGYAVSVYFCTFRGYILGAIFLGYFSARGGFLMHMGNHAAMSKFPALNELYGRLMDLVGASSVLWLFEHQVAHHMDPNEFGSDNDCEIGTPLLRFHPAIPRSWVHKNQHITTLIAMTGGTMKWFFSDFVNIIRQRITNVSFSITTRDLIFFAFFKTQWVIFHAILPFYLHDWKVAALNMFIVFAVSSHVLENIFIVNHIQEGLVPPNNLHWANCQVLSSSNWSSGSFFWNWYSGGLNHQIEHHLFPSMSHYNYPVVSPVVREVCAEFGLPYKNFPSFFSAWISMLTYLRDLGTPKFDSLQHKAH
jgi:fatty acid desaturase/cytochrome b involved in lipid metabolism